MTVGEEHWAGIDVGASKGFDVAVIDRNGLCAPPERIRRTSDVVAYLEDHRPQVIAIDSPCCAAPDGMRSRDGERELVRAGVCGIRYTPNEKALAANENYYAWIVNGFGLYEALRSAALPADCMVIECFPTATWSRLGGRKGKWTRALWSRTVLEGLGLRNLPSRMNQDARDAIGAAITARLHDEDGTERFGEIVLPRVGCRSSGKG
jgi:predicted nuclease with RNAse H fold